MDTSGGISSLLATSDFQYAVAAKILNVSKQSGDASIALLQSAAKVAKAGAESSDQALTNANQLLDIYA